MWDDVVVAARQRSRRAGMPVRASPGRQAPRRCRTSAPTAPRWPTPSPGCGCWTAAAARCAGCRPSELGFGYRTSVLKEHRGHAGGAGGGVRPGRVGPQRAAALRRVDHRAGRATPGSAPIPARCARRCWRCAAARAWCSTRPTTTPGASARSSPTRWSRRSVIRAAGPTGRRAGTALSRRRTGSSWPRAGWSSEPASARASPAPDAPARLSTKHALALTNRGDATSADVIALARTVRDGVRDAFGITLEPEPVLVGCVI